MPRIDTTDRTQKWRFACPTRWEHRHWRVVDGLFECHECGETFRYLRDLRSGDEIPRSEFDFVGPLADSKGQFGTPRTEGD